LSWELAGQFPQHAPQNPITRVEYGDVNQMKS